MYWLFIHRQMIDSTSSVGRDEKHDTSKKWRQNLFIPCWQPAMQVILEFIFWGVFCKRCSFVFIGSSLQAYIFKCCCIFMEQLGFNDLMQKKKKKMLQKRSWEIVIESWVIEPKDSQSQWSVANFVPINLPTDAMMLWAQDEFLTKYAAETWGFLQSLLFSQLLQWVSFKMYLGFLVFLPSCLNRLVHNGPQMWL